MEWYKLMAVGALAICLLSCLFHMLRLIRKGNPVDYAVPAGDTTRAVIYSFTGAMSPSKKESAYLHLPTYTAGILYHLGTFAAIILFFIFLAGYNLTGVFKTVMTGFLLLTTMSGFWILLKRIISAPLRSLSNPDDYISNAIVTLFQGTTIAAFFLFSFQQVYFIVVTILLLYLPIGKLRHAVYFFAARYHLGYFFGYRGTWPPIKRNS